MLTYLLGMLFLCSVGMYIHLELQGRKERKNRKMRNDVINYFNHNCQRYDGLKWFDIAYEYSEETGISIKKVCDAFDINDLQSYSHYYPKTYNYDTKRASK